MKAKQLQSTEPIAIVGMALRVPGADNLEGFWDIVKSGRDTISRQSVEELRKQGISENALKDPRYVRSHPGLKDVEYFDRELFKMSPYETNHTDPVHRIFLECVWEVLELAAIRMDSKGSAVGVFSGVEGDYRTQFLLPTTDESDPSVRTTNRLGSETEFAASRASYKLNLNGPSFAVESACATSLTAIHLAANSLRNGECDVAVAGGGTVLLQDWGGYIAGVDGMYSAIGKVCAFDESADGTIFGSGAGVVALRPLSDAIANGNHIHAVLLGSATSNDGCPAEKESFIAPSSHGQSLAISRAINASEVEESTIGYVEAHGTATLLGDPVEFETLSNLYSENTSKKNYCAIGSVKSNVGHLRNAAGVISFIKACMVLEQKTIPPGANYTTPNPLLDIESSPFYLPIEPHKWEPTEHPRRAAVSAFGFGGSNAHVILEEFQSLSAKDEEPSSELYLLPLSAASPEALRRLAFDIKRTATNLFSNSLADVAHTLQQRQEQNFRACLFAQYIEQNHSVEFLHQENGLSEGSISPTVFMFPGQGTQRIGMARELYDEDPIFSTNFNECADLFHLELGIDIRDLTLLDLDQATIEQNQQITQTEVAQPCLFSMGYAMAKAFESHGVVPSVMIGHSIGEIAAAAVSGIFSLEDAIKLVSTRASLMQKCDPGSMLAIFMTVDQVEEILPVDLEVGAINSPSLTVVSGSMYAIEEFEKVLNVQGTGFRRLQTSHAFHSYMMDDSLHEFRRMCDSLEFHPTKIPVVSNLSGQLITDIESLNPAYWADQVRYRVNFSKGVNTLLADYKDAVYIEMGPGSTLCDLVLSHDDQVSTIAVTDFLHGQVSNSLINPVMLSIAKVWCASGKMDWTALGGDDCRRVQLPTYPFQRRKSWVDEPLTNFGRDLLFFESGWSLSERIQDQDSTLIQKRWIIFCDEFGVAETLCKKLESEVEQVILIRSGEEYATISSNEFVINNNSQSEFRQVLKVTNLLDSIETLGVIHLATLTGSSGPHNNIEAFQQTCQSGFYSVVAFLQLMHEYSGGIPIHFLVVTDGMTAIDNEQAPSFSEKSVLIGLCKVVPKEMSEVNIVGIDVPILDKGPGVEWVVNSLLNELALLASKKEGEDLIALRGNGRFVEQLTRLPDLSRSRPYLRHNGVVLISGGLGALGLSAAKVIFDTSRARLVLISRNTFSNNWEAVSKQNDNNGLIAKQLLELKNFGAEILVVEADVSERADLVKVISKANSVFGSIHGVIHAAGTSEPQPTVYKDQDSAEKVFSGKVLGAYLLNELLGDSNLDFFINYSSQSSVTPNIGQVDYCSANAVLNAISKQRAIKTGGLNVAIGWGVWQDAGLALKEPKKLMENKRKKIRMDDNVRQQSSVTFDHPLIREAYTTPTGERKYFGRVHPHSHWCLDGHRFNSRVLMPGTVFIECFYAAFFDYCGSSRVQFVNFSLLKPLFLDEGETEFRISIIEKQDYFSLVFESRCGEMEWILHAQTAAKICNTNSKKIKSPKLEDLGRAQKEYGRNAWSFGPHWQCLDAACYIDNETWVELSTPENCLADVEPYLISPALFDRGLIEVSHSCSSDTMPFSYESIAIFGPISAKCRVYGRKRDSGESNVFDVQITSYEGDVIVEIKGFIRRAISLNVERRSKAEDKTGDKTKAEAELFVESYKGEFKVVVDTPGDLDSIRVIGDEPKKIGDSDLRVQVVCSGLNFRDVLGALGQLSEIEPGEILLGVECSGIVMEVGNSVTHFNVGDPVFGLSRPGMVSEICVPVSRMRSIPHGISFEEASGIPTVFLTAYYSLYHLAQIYEGERVLIHAATGGVGLAAIQLAELRGAEIFATAGSDEKRDYLRKIGIENVFDSRSLSFVDDILQATSGEGVDVVLNSLSGEFIEAGFSLLRAAGRFVEIGKRDIYANNSLGLKHFSRNLSYFSVDLAVVEQERPRLYEDMFDNLINLFATTKIKPLPTTAIDVSQISAGFKRMANASQIGKLVFNMRPFNLPLDHPANHAASIYNFKKTYGPGIAVDRGNEALRQILQCDSVPSSLLALSPEVESTLNVDTMVREKSMQSRPELDIPFVQPNSDDEKRLASHWEKFLGIAPIGSQDDFFALGGDSLSAMQIQTIVNNEFKVNISMGQFLEKPTVSGLIDAVHNITNAKSK